MNRTERFEDLIAWQKARSLTAAIYQVTREPRFARDFGLAAQLQRAAVSISRTLLRALNETGPENFTSFSRSRRARVLV